MGLTTTSELALATHQVKALRNADDVSFHYHDDRCYIRATRQYDPGDGFGRRPIEIEVPAEPGWMFYNDHGGHQHRLEAHEAFYSLGSAKFCPEWVTAVKFLKVGDELVLRWTTGSSIRIRDAGLRLVEFRLEVRRVTGRNKREHLVFHLGNTVELASSVFSIKFK